MALRGVAARGVRRPWGVRRPRLCSCSRVALPGPSPCSASAAAGMSSSPMTPVVDEASVESHPPDCM